MIITKKLQLGFAADDSDTRIDLEQDSYSETLNYPVVNNLLGLTDYEGEWTTPDLPVIDY